VVSGGYPDDEDHGDVIVYTGQGGRDPDTKQQVADQQLSKRNLGLARCRIDGLPVRVVRGADGDPIHSPPSGCAALTSLDGTAGRHGGNAVATNGLLHQQVLS
jgi:hypothetical protein